MFQDGWNTRDPGRVHYDSEDNDRKHYMKHANTIKSQIRFKKVAYPDYIGAETQSGIIEPLLEKNRSACRAKVLQNLRIVLNEVDETEQNVVYDLDELILRDENNSDHPKELRSDDDFLIFTNQTASANMSWDQQKRKHLLFESRFESGNLRWAIIRLLKLSNLNKIVMKYFLKDSLKTFFYILGKLFKSGIENTI